MIFSADFLSHRAQSIQLKQLIRNDDIRGNRLPWCAVGQTTSTWGATVRVWVEHYLIDPLKSVSIVVKIAEEQRGAVDHEIGVLTGLLRHDNMAYCCVNC